MREIVLKEQLNATEFVINNNDSIYMRTCCGKINILHNNKKITGYILDKQYEKWKILLAFNEIIYLKAIKYNKEEEKYIYRSTGRYKISFYWPI